MIARNEDGSLPAFAWPGGYPLYYVCQDGETLCQGQWLIVGQEVNYEDDSLFCDHCNAKVEAAYVD